MKRFGLLLLVAIGCFFLLSKKGKQVKNIGLSYIPTPSFINEEGATVSERILLPEGFKRATYPQNSFSESSDK